MWANHRTRTFTYLVAEDTRTGKIVGTVTGVDHALAFGDPEGGTSLWCLVADKQDAPPGTGEALVRVLAERYVGRGRAYLDLSVMHDNTPAITLYRKLGFTRVPAVCVKRKNPINTPLFASRPPGLENLNPYALIIAEEALRRGIRVEVTDAEWGEMRLTVGGRTVLTRESLSEFTTAVAHEPLRRQAGHPPDHAARRACGSPAGRWPPTATWRDAAGPAAPTSAPSSSSPPAASRAAASPSGVQRRGRTASARSRWRCSSAPTCSSRSWCPARTCGSSSSTGRSSRPPSGGPPRSSATAGTTVADLVRSTSRRRERATGGESRIPLDDTTAEVVAEAGYAMDDVPPNGERIQVRRTANLHTGGTIEDVTDRLHPEIAEAAVRAAEALGIPVTGIDFLVPDVDGPDYVFIEANERPGLANHEPQPTAERFVDLLFPETRRR